MLNRATKNFIFIISSIFLISYFGIRSKEINRRNEKHFVLFVTGRNLKKCYEKNLDSIFNQTYTNYDVIYVDDHSEDNTVELAKKHVVKNHFHLHNNFHDKHGNMVEIYIKENGVKIIYIQNKERRYKMTNQYDSIHEYCEDTDILVEIDADDWFATDDALAYLNKIYSDPNIWLTYGKFRWHPSGKIAFPRDIPKEILVKNEIRTYDFLYGGLRTYYSWLFKLVKKEDLIYQGTDVDFKGKFVPIASDASIMFPMLEMCRKGHFKFIPEVLHICNRDRDEIYSKKMKKVRSEVRNGLKHKDRYPALVTPVY